MAGGVTPWNDVSYVYQAVQPQAEPSTAVIAANGNFLTVWVEYDPALGRNVIKGTLRAFDGTILHNGFLIYTFQPFAGASVDNPSVSVVNGYFVVTFEGGNLSTGNIYTVVLDSSGQREAEVLQVNTTTAGPPQNSKVIPLSSGYMVVWEANGAILSQTFDSLWNKVGTETRVNTAGLDSFEPSVATMSGGRSVVGLPPEK